MNASNKLLSDIVFFRSYAKFLPHLERRESPEETINRCMTMHLDKFAGLGKGLSADIIKAFGKVQNYDLMPSMRTLQFSGDAIIKNNLRTFNCAFEPIDNIRAFDEALFVLLSGVGFGFSVAKRHINKLPAIQLPREENIFYVADSIEGWGQALQLLVEAYFLKRIRPIFDFSNIRPVGSYVSLGARAPGPEPLRRMLSLVEAKLKMAVGRKLRPIEVHDIICIIADCVLAGGVRRSSLISLFDLDDKEMLGAKSGNWWDKNPWRARANNSAYLFRSKTTFEEFEQVFNACKNSDSGEPGWLWINNKDDIGTNPCAEISLNPSQFCNLTEVNLTTIKDKRDFLSRVYSATLIGTLQASYTDFPYLRDKWKRQTEEEALLGVSMTGIADRPIPVEWLEEGATLCREVNDRYAKKIGINAAARLTTGKPSGTTSAVLSSSSGIHARHSQYYIRRIRMNKYDALSMYLKETIPDLVEDDVTSDTGIVVSIPQDSPDGALIRDTETALQLFERAIKWNKHWVVPGHRSGDNKNNISCTISVKPNEWDSLKDNMWAYKDYYSGISLLPFSNPSYAQLPFESCSKEKFDEMFAYVKNIDLREVKEEKDMTNRISEMACVGRDSCEIK